MTVTGLDVNLSDIRALRGPNRWASVSVLEAGIDCKNWRVPEDGSSPFHERWREWLPVFDTLVEQSSPLSKGHLGDAPPCLAELHDVLARPTHITKVVEVTTRLLQSLAGAPAEFGTTRATEVPHIYQVAVESEEELYSRRCLETAIELCQVASDHGPFDLLARVRELVTFAEDVRLGPSSLAILRAAMARDIPYMRLNNGSLVQLGEGCNQRRVWTAETDATSAIAESIAQDKDLTKRFLQSVGVPVPKGRPVRSADDAWEVACEVGLPVTIKPQGANHARGISLDLKTEEEIIEAYDWAVTDGGDTGVLVEQFVVGHPHRLLVVGDKLVAAATGRPEYVVGDGSKTIQQLVDSLNEDFRRGENYSDLLSVLKVDPAALIELRKQELTPDCIPEAGRMVLVQRVGDLTFDCTAEVHPMNAAKAVLAAKAIGLDVAGIDAIATDIRIPFSEQRGAILEVNAGPSLAMHVAPLHGSPQPVGEAIMSALFPDGSEFTVPVVIVTGSGNRARTVVDVASALINTGCKVGYANADGLYFDGELLSEESESDHENLWALRLHPLAEVIVCESRPDQAERQGLGCPRADLVIVTAGEEGRLGEILGTIAAIRAIPNDGALAIESGGAGWVSQLMATCNREDVELSPSPGRWPPATPLQVEFAPHMSRCRAIRHALIRSSTA